MINSILGIFREEKALRLFPLMKMARNREEKRQKLIAALSPEQKKLLDKLVQADEEMESSRAFDKFKYGFHLGVLMMMEIMESYEDMLS